jgi:hypothetical protein
MVFDVTVSGCETLFESGLPESSQPDPWCSTTWPYEVTWRRCDWYAPADFD